MQEVRERLLAVSRRFASQRAERQARTHLERSDFDALAETGFLASIVPRSHGGLFEGLPRSLRPICEALRTIAQGDPSVALVAAMHPAVLIFWAALDQADPEHADAWDAQRAAFFASALAGHWWGTITSEPGSGGDVLRTRSIARETGDGWSLTGDKHFGSGSGIASFMMTTALPERLTLPDLFVLDMRGVPWDGSTGARMIAEWDGHGMAATQSHAFRFDAFPVQRSAWPGSVLRAAPIGAQVGACAFTAVVLGVVQSAVAAARERLSVKKETLRAYEQIEWTRAVREAWLCEQAYEGMLRAVESQDRPFASALQGKVSVAELAESLTRRLCKVVGGGSFSRSSPVGRFAEDVRALGFLRPPWGLVHDQLLSASFDAPPDPS